MVILIPGVLLLTVLKCDGSRKKVPRNGTTEDLIDMALTKSCWEQVRLVFLDKDKRSDLF